MSAIIETIRSLQGQVINEYNTNRLISNVTVAYCARANVEAGHCVQFLRATHLGESDRLFQAPNLVTGVLASSGGRRNGLELAEHFTQLIEQRVAVVTADDDKGFVRYFAVKAISEMANALSKKGRTINDLAASRLTSAQSLWARAKQILFEKDRHPANMGLLIKIAEGQLDAGLVIDAAETAADVLEYSTTDSLGTAFLKAFVGEFSWNEIAPTILPVQYSLDRNLAMLMGVRIPLAVSEWAFKKNDAVLGREALELAASIMGRTSAPTILRGHFASFLAAYPHREGWAKFQSANTLFRNMSKRLYDNLAMREAKEALALAYYNYLSVKKGDRIVRSFTNFGWEDERDMPYARAVGLMRERGAAEALSSLQSVYRREDIRRLHEKLILSLTHSGRFREAIDLSLDETVALEDKFRAHALLDVAVAAAESGEYGVVRRISDWLEVTAPEHKNSALREIAQDRIYDELYAQAAEVLVKMEADNDPIIRDTDRLRLITAAGLLRKGETRRAVEVVNSVQDMNALIEGYLSVGLHLSR